MVRREEQPWQSRATLFLDNRKQAHRGRGAASSLEHAVTVAASIAVHLVQRGFTVRLVTASGEEQGGAWHERGGQAGEVAPLLESLAVVTEVARPDLDTRWLQDPGHSGLLVAVVGAVDDHDKASFTRMRHTAATAMAVALDVDSWSGRGPRRVEADHESPGAVWLRAQGWQTSTAAPGNPVPTVWQELGLTSGRASRDTSTGTVTGGRRS
jgi:uncharacterized protein (DUF58 family)